MSCELVQVAAHPAALSEQSGNGSQGFFSAAGNDNGALDLRIVQRTADEGGQGEMKEFCCALEFHLFSFRHTELDDVRFVVRRVVAVGRAGIRFDISHCVFGSGVLPIVGAAFIIFVTMQQSMVQIEFCLHPEKV